MIHPDTELRFVNGAIGLGVFATRPLRKGTVVWVLDELDQRLAPERAARLARRYGSLLERYAYVNAVGEHVLCWDLARWVNHSCEPSVLSTGWEFDVAVRDISPGEEITNDYGALNLSEGFDCHCGQPGCRRRIRPGDFERLADHWDARAREAFLQLRAVPQPLWQWVPERRQVVAALRHPDRMPSIRQHRWKPLPAVLPDVRHTSLGRG